MVEKAQLAVDCVQKRSSRCREDAPWKHVVQTPHVETRVQWRVVPEVDSCPRRWSDRRNDSSLRLGALHRSNVRGRQLHAGECVDAS